MERRGCLTIITTFTKGVTNDFPLGLKLLGRIGDNGERQSPQERYQLEPNRLRRREKPLSHFHHLHPRPESLLHTGHIRR